MRSAAAAACLLFLAAGCSSSSSVEPEVKELSAKGSSALSEGTTEESLFNNAKHLYASGTYSIAKDSFQSLSANFGQGPYGEFAEIKVADALLESSDFAGAATAFEQFVTSHPSSPNAPYAMLRAAQSYQLSTKGDGRDPAPLEKALSLSDKLLQRFPDSPYAGVARNVRSELLKGLAEHERLVAEFYERRDAPKASEARRNIIAAKWDPLLQSAAQEAQAPQPTPAPLPDAAPAPVTPAVPVQNTAQAALAVKSDAAAPPAAAPAAHRVERAVCAGSMIFLFLKEPFTDRAFVAEHRRSPVTPHQPFTLALPAGASEGIEINCFGVKDLTVSKEGLVTLRDAPASAIAIMALEQPPRLAIVLEK